MERAEKHAEVEELVGRFVKSQVVVCIDYRGLTVARITQLRRELRGAGSTGKVVRNTLGRLAVRQVTKSQSAADAQVEKFLTTLDGPTMVITCENDPISPAKVLAKFAKDLGKESDKFRVKGCWLDGAYVDPAGVDALSKMPGREETFAMLLSLMSEPATRLVRVLSEPGAQVARAVEAYRKKLGGEGAAA